jgi:hypothetical protein
MDAEKIAKTNQQQAVGAWVNYLNQVRIDRLVAALARQSENWNDAMEAISDAISKINISIIGRNRGGNKGMHGFIAEIAECGIGNARQIIEDKLPTYEWINDNGPVDIIRGAQEIQQKFVQSGGHLSLRAIAEHLRTYPDYIKNGGLYQIPKDQYDKIQYYLNISESVANKMPTSTGEFSLKQWKEVQAFFADGKVPLQQLEPSILEYSEVQADAVSTTFEHEKERLNERDQERRDAAYHESKPTFSEGAKVTVASAAIEGGMALCMSISRKRKTGKKLKDFDESDWKSIAGEAGTGTVHGAVRGASMYLLTNYTATPAAVASAITTASFGVAEQAYLYREGKIGETEFIENSELLCLDAAVSAISSFAGQALIPIPILGAVIGNTIGTVMYQIAKDSLSRKEQAIINGYLCNLDELDKHLAYEYEQSLAQLNIAVVNYMELLAYAFSPNAGQALNGSVDLAKHMGVPTEEILDSREKIIDYFTN